MPISFSTSAIGSPCSISAARWPPERPPKFASIRRWSVLTSAPEPLLSVGALESGYGKIRVLHGIDCAISPGEVVALLGPNGAGKSTMLRALSGLLPVTSGYVRFDGRDITNATPREAARAGLVHVIEVDRVLNVIGQLRQQGTAVLLVEQLLEKALAAADRVYALVQGHVVLEAQTSEDNLPQRLDRAYFGHDSHAPVVG